MAQTILIISYLEIQSPHYIGTWTLNDRDPEAVSETAAWEGASWFYATKDPWKKLHWLYAIKGSSGPEEGRSRRVAPWGPILLKQVLQVGGLRREAAVTRIPD